MVVDELLSTPKTDKVFHALADATRRDIVRTVLIQPHSVSALARRYPMSFAAVQKHVAVLEEAGRDERAHKAAYDKSPEAQVRTLDDDDPSVDLAPECPVERSPHR